LLVFENKIIKQKLINKFVKEYNINDSKFQIIYYSAILALNKKSYDKIIFG